MTWISNPTPVEEPGMWHLRREDEGSMEFVHRLNGEVVNLEREPQRQLSDASIYSRATDHTERR